MSVAGLSTHYTSYTDYSDYGEYKYDPVMDKMDVAGALDMAMENIIHSIV